MKTSTGQEPSKKCMCRQQIWHISTLLIGKVRVHVRYRKFANLYCITDKAIPDWEPTATSKNKPIAANAAKPTDLFCRSILATRTRTGDVLDLERHACHHYQSSKGAVSSSQRQKGRDSCDMSACDLRHVSLQRAPCWLATSPCKLHSCSTTEPFTEKIYLTDRQNFNDT